MRSEPRLGIADALFSSTQQRVLALIYGQPERSFTVSEQIALVRGGSGAVQRELARLYGSVANGSDTASSDIDMLIVSDHLSLEAAAAASAPPPSTSSPRSSTA